MDRTAIGSEFRMFQMTMTQHSMSMNLRNCMLLDNESTVHAFCNEHLVNKVAKDASGETITLCTNGGDITTDLQCKIENLKQTVWFDK